MGDRKRKYNLRFIWDAIMYLVKTGYQWRMLPNDFPKRQLAYYYYSKWANSEGLSDINSEINDLLCKNLRKLIEACGVRTGQPC